MTTFIKSCLLVGIGAAVGIAVMFALEDRPDGQSLNESDEPKILYWVAPMDDNYRRDQPGKSPMGMDLVPVYENSTPSQDDAIEVSSYIENSLGVRTDVAKKIHLEDTVEVAAYVSYDENRIVHIHPRLSGWIDTLYVKSQGEQVEKGQPLYRLYSPELVNAQQEYLLALQQKDRTIIASSANKLMSLNLSNKFVDELRRSRKVSQRVTFYSPQSGVLKGLQIREGYFVEPGTTLMSIANIDTLWVEASVPERYATNINVGQSVAISFESSTTDKRVAQIEYIHPELNESNRTVKARVSVENKNNALMPNMFARMSLSMGAVHGALVVPREAVIRMADHDRVVTALGEGRYRSAEVKLGMVTDQWAEIVEGLSEGESVVTSAQFLLDSESNKKSEFKRLDQPRDDGHDHMNHDDMNHHMSHDEHGGAHD